MIRSKPASLVAASTSGSAWLTSLPASRVASASHVHARAGARHPRVDRVHADAVAQQRAAALAARRVDRDDGDAQLVALVEADAADQLVGQRRLARAAGAGDADDGGLDVPARPRARRRTRSSRQPVVLERRDQLRQLAPRALGVAGDFRRDRSARCDDRSLSQFITISPIMPARPMRWPSSGLKMRTPLSASARISAGTITPPPPPNTWMCSPPRCLEQVDHVAEVLVVAALVAADGDALRVFLQRGRDDLVDRPVVPQVHHLGAHALQDASHDVDRGVVAVEQARGGDEAHLVGGPVVGEGLEFSGEVGHGNRVV